MTPLQGVERFAAIIDRIYGCGDKNDVGWMELPCVRYEEASARPDISPGHPSMS